MEWTTVVGNNSDAGAFRIKTYYHALRASSGLPRPSLLEKNKNKIDIYVQRYSQRIPQGVYISMSLIAGQ
jgi:hypothetical protein